MNQQSITNEQVAVLGSNSIRRTPLSIKPVEPACLSGASTPIENEPVMDCCLVVTTLSGKAIQLSLSVAKFDRFEDLEGQVTDYLASVTDLAVFERSIDFLHLATQTYLENPIWDKLQQSKEYCIIFRDCSETLHTQELLEGCPVYAVPLAIHVPMNPEEIVPEGAFAGVPRLRHVSIESGIRLIGADAWQNCRQLRIVKLPTTVVGISDNVFRNCKLLNSVSAPGCRQFGYKAFAECCSLQNGYTQLKELPIGLVTTLSLGTISFKGVSTSLSLPCKSSTPQAEGCCQLLPVT